MPPSIVADTAPVCANPACSNRTKLGYETKQGVKKWYATCSRSCSAKAQNFGADQLGKVRSAETKKRMSEVVKRAHADPNSAYNTKEYRQKISASLVGNQRAVGYKHTEATRKVISEKNLKAWQKGDRTPGFQPQWERDLSRYFDRIGMEYTKQFKLPSCPHPYDFYLPELGLIIELDGCYWHGCLECYPGDDQFEDVRVRDQECTLLAEAAGYTVIRVREHELEDLSIIQYMSNLLEFTQTTGE